MVRSDGGVRSGPDALAIGPVGCGGRRDLADVEELAGAEAILGHDLDADAL